MKKNITIFSLNSYSIFNPENSKAPIGGAEVEIYNISNFLSRNNYNVNIIVGDFGQKNTETYNNITLKKSIKIGNKGIIYGLKNIINIFFILYREKSNTIIFKGASHYIFIGIIIKLISKKIIIYRTSSDIDCNGEYISNKGFFGKLFKIGLKHSDLIIAQTIINEKELIKNNYNKAKNIIVMKNIFNITNLKISNYNNRNYILWVGRCDKNKRPHIFIDLAEKNKDKDFIIIAPKQKHFENLYNEIINRCKKLDNIKFYERMPFQETQLYFNNSLVFVGTSVYEGFPNTYIQALLGGTPIISLNVDPNNFISNYETGYSCNNNINELNDKLNYICNEGIWGKKSKNCIKYVKDNHSEEKEGQILLKALKKYYV